MSNESDYVVDGTRLVLRPDRQVSFDDPIEKVIDFGNVIAVLLAAKGGSNCGENIFGVNRDGVVMWRVPHLRTRYVNSPYRSMVRLGDVIAAGKSEGLEVQIDPLTGTIVKKEFRRF